MKKIGQRGGRAYERRGDGNDTPLVPGLNNGRAEAFDGIGKKMEITGQEPVMREIIPENIKKLHQSCGYIFWQSQIRGKRQSELEIADQGG